MVVFDIQPSLSVSFLGVCTNFAGLIGHLGLFTHLSLLDYVAQYTSIMLPTSTILAVITCTRISARRVGPHDAVRHPVKFHLSHLWVSILCLLA